MWKYCCLVLLLTLVFVLYTVRNEHAVSFLPNYDSRVGFLMSDDTLGRRPTIYQQKGLTPILGDDTPIPQSGWGTEHYNDPDIYKLADSLYGGRT